MGRHLLYCDLSSQGRETAEDTRIGDVAEHSIFRDSSMERLTATGNAKDSPVQPSPLVQRNSSETLASKWTLVTQQATCPERSGFGFDTFLAISNRG